MLDEDDFSDLDEFDEEPVQEDPVNDSVWADEEDDEPEAEDLSRLAQPVFVSRNAAPSEAEPIRRPLMSGHCAHHSEGSHERCERNGAGSRANPDKIFQPCPCRDHFPDEEFECECGATIVAAPHYPLDEDGDVRYVHFDPKTGRIVDEECPR